MKMNGNNCLVDTSIIVHIFKKNIAHAQRLESLEKVFTSSTVIGELYFGAYASPDTSKKIHEIENLLKNCTILFITPATADLFGQIKAKLRSKGKPIPENDIWIAASAIEHKLPIYTSDRHFNDIEGLTILQ